ncbi:hypothetical protein [Streptomyces californicus]|uniref:hypothetical protein n=1 Tax=Streptomyces californicus TaxID=67351 RepID=UPI003321D87F
MAATKTTWKVFARAEKNGEFAEYDDVATVFTDGVPSSKYVVAAQLAQILQHYPHLRGGTVSGTATRIN